MTLRELLAKVEEAGGDLDSQIQIYDDHADNPMTGKEGAPLEVGWVREEEGVFVLHCNFSEEILDYIS